PPPTSDQLCVRSQNRCARPCRSVCGSSRLIERTNPAKGRKCQGPFSRACVGKFYARRDWSFRSANENGEIPPLIRFGTPIATISASTWFHSQRRDGSEEVLWSPPHRPFLVSGPIGRTWRFQQFLQLAALEHLHHDVRSADELALDVELGDGRPVAIRLDASANLGVLEHVDGLVFRAQSVEDGDRAARKSALREERSALHEQHNVIRIDDLGNFLFWVSHGWSPLAALLFRAAVREAHPRRVPRARHRPPDAAGSGLARRSSC